MASVNSAIKSRIENWWDQYSAQLAAMLGLPLATPNFEVVPADKLINEGAAAEADGNTIRVSKEWFQSHKDDAGAILHEGTHFLMLNAGLPDTEANAKWAEAISDVARYKLGLTYDGWSPSLKTQRLAELKNWQIQTVSGSMMNGTFNPALLKQLENGDITRDDFVRAMESTTGVQGGGGGPIPGLHDTASTDSNSPFGNFNINDFQDQTTTEGPTRKVDTPEERDVRRNSRASLLNSIATWGIPLTDNIMALVNQSWRRGYDYFLSQLRQTKEYRQAFPGIFDSNGTLKMSEDQYMAEVKNYENYAHQAGISMGPKRTAWLFKNDVTSSEFADRAEAFKRLQRDKQLYQSFGRELVQAGIAKPKDVDTNKEMFKFVMGEGNQKWYDLWQDAVTRNAATMAGLTVAKAKQGYYTNLAQGVIERISGMDLSEEDMNAKFTQLEEGLRTVLPTTEAGLYGVDKKALTKAVFGGKGASKAKGKVQRAMDTAEAFSGERAGTQTYTDESGRVTTLGVTDTQRRAQSDY